MGELAAEYKRGILMKKIFCLLTALVCLLGTAALAEEPDYIDSGDYQYYLLDDGTAMLRMYCVSDYHGDSSETLVIPSSIDGHPVSGLDYGLFWGNSDDDPLVRVIIPETVTYIGARAFCDCGNLAGVSIMGPVTYIGVEAFDECRSLTVVVLPETVTYIGEDAFYDCRNLISINLPASVTYIDGGAFWGCENLVATVSRGSYAETYCKDQGIPCVSLD